MRAVVLDEHGQPALSDVAEPDGELVRILACGLCGSDVEKIGVAPAGTVLGHEVAAEAGGRRVALVHHLPCGECERCRSGHESTCDAFGAATIVPGGFAERARASAVLPLPDDVDDATATYAEPLACVLRAVERLPRGRVLVVGNGFVGRLFGAVLRRRGDEASAVDADPRRHEGDPEGRFDAAVLTASGGATEAAEALVPGGTAARLRPLRPARPRRRLPARADRARLPFGDAAPHARGDRPASRAGSSRSDRPAVGALRRRPRALPERRGGQGRLHAVRALVFHGPGDLRLETVPDPVPGAGDVLVQVEVALTDGTDAKAFRRGHPLLLGPPPSPFGHEFCGIDVASGRRVVAANSSPCGECTACSGEETLCENLLPLLNGAYAELILVPDRIARRNLLPVPPGLAPEVAALVEPLACCLHGVQRAGIEEGDSVAILGAGPIGLMLSACVADAGGRPSIVGGRAERRELGPLFGATQAAGPADVVIEAAGTEEAWLDAVALARPGGTVVLFGELPQDTRVAVDAHRLHYEELTLRGAFHHTPATVRAALVFLASGAYPWERLITHRVGLDGVAALLAEPPRDYLKAAVLP